MSRRPPSLDASPAESAVDKELSDFFPASDPSSWGLRREPAASSSPIDVPVRPVAGWSLGN
jgi:hypothetical protein